MSREKKKTENFIVFNNQELEALFDLLFSAETINQMKEWYKSIIHSDSDFVVFMVRRCYLVALLLEQLTGIRMDENGRTRYLTDGAIFLHTGEIANDYLATGRMPRILIVDDLLIHGRSINHLVRVLEEELFREMKISHYLQMTNEDEAQYIVHRDLSRAIGISIFERASGQSVLDRSIRNRVRYFKGADAPKWRGFSNSVSALILASGIPNAAYVYTEEISGLQFERLPKKDFIYTEYQNTNEYTKVYSYHDGNTIKAIGTIRVVKHKFSNKYRVIPFVFMPSMDDYEETLLFERLRNKVSACSVYYDEIISWRERFGRRTFNEYISLILSSALLNSFNDFYSITYQRSPFEVAKLARNYYGESHDFEFYCRLISDSVESTRLSDYELQDILVHTIGYHEETSMGLIRYSQEQERWWQDDEERLKKEIEDLFYRMGINEEIQAAGLKRNDHMQSSKRYARNLFKSYDIIWFIYTELCSKHTMPTLQLVVALMLQFMDAGILAISSYPSVDFKVEGFMQFAKAGEQSLFIRPIRNYRYLPMLGRAEEEARIHEHTLEEELRIYFSSELCAVPEKDKDELLYFSFCLDRSYQNAKDWDINLLLMKMRFSEEDGMIREFSELMQVRREMLNNYKTFCDMNL